MKQTYDSRNLEYGKSSQLRVGNRPLQWNHNIEVLAACSKIALKSRLRLDFGKAN